MHTQSSYITWMVSSVLFASVTQAQTSRSYTPHFFYSHQSHLPSPTIGYLYYATEAIHQPSTHHYGIHATTPKQKEPTTSTFHTYWTSIHSHTKKWGCILWRHKLAIGACLFILKLILPMLYFKFPQPQPWPAVKRVKIKNQENKYVYKWKANPTAKLYTHLHSEEGKAWGCTAALAIGSILFGSLYAEKKYPSYTFSKPLWIDLAEIGVSLLALYYIPKLDPMPRRILQQGYELDMRYVVNPSMLYLFLYNLLWEGRLSFQSHHVTLPG